jgi:hypothetical protein
VWYAFLAEEAYFEGDMETHDAFMGAAESLSRSPQGSLHSKKLEEKIRRYYEQNG